MDTSKQYKAVKVVSRFDDNRELIIPLYALQLYRVVTGATTVIYIARDMFRGGPGPLDLASLSLGSLVITKESYDLLTGVLERFNADPDKFEGSEVLYREDWDSIVNDATENWMTVDTIHDIWDRGHEADVRYRGTDGKAYKGNIKYVTPWSHKNNSGDMEYFIMCSRTASTHHLMRSNSVQVTSSEYGRVVDILKSFENGTATKTDLSPNSTIEFRDINGDAQHGILGEIHVWKTMGIVGVSGYYVYLGKSESKMTTDNSIQVSESEAARLKDLVKRSIKKQKGAES